MKHLFTVLLAVMSICIGSQAQAALLTNWTLDLTSLGGPQITNINSLSMVGTVNLAQNVSGPGGTPQVGDTFTISNTSNPLSPIVFTAASYVNSAIQQITPLLASGEGTLVLQTPQLTGSISAILPGNMYRYVYDSPGANTLSLIYTSPSAVSTTLATFTLQTPNSGGLSTDEFVGGTGLQQGTSNLYGFMTVTQAGVLFDENGVDLSTLGLIQMAALSSGLNYNATNNGEQILASIASDGNFTISAVPEPASLLLLGGGALGMSLIGRRGRKTIAA